MTSSADASVASSSEFRDAKEAMFALTCAASAVLMRGEGARFGVGGTFIIFSIGIAKMEWVGHCRDAKRFVLDHCHSGVGLVFRQGRTIDEEDLL
jgi:hypothetical protein